MAIFKKTTFLAIPITLYALFVLVPAAATLQELQVGMDMPDFSLQAITGEKKGFSDLRGERLTIIYFWSTWSKNSAKGLARMEKLHRLYGGKGLGVIGINADEQRIGAESKARIEETVKELGITFPVLIDQGLSLFHDVGVIALPTTVIVDRERVIRYELSGYPLVGVEEMADFVATTLEGKKTVQTVEKKGYLPDKGSLRYYNMGRKSLKTKRSAEKAEDWFKKAIEADPRFVQPRISLGRLYLGKGDAVSAKEHFARSLELEPDNVVALCEMAMITANEGNTKEAMALFERSMKKDDTYPPCYYYRGYLLGKSGRMEEAMKLFDEAAEINPLDYRSHIFRGKLLEEKGTPQQAAAEYRKALELIMKVQ